MRGRSSSSLRVIGMWWFVIVVTVLVLAAGAAASAGAGVLASHHRCGSMLDRVSPAPCRPGGGTTAGCTCRRRRPRGVRRQGSCCVALNTPASAARGITASTAAQMAGSVMRGRLENGPGCVPVKGQRRGQIEDQGAALRDPGAECRPGFGPDLTVLEPPSLEFEPQSVILLGARRGGLSARGGGWRCAAAKLARARAPVPAFARLRPLPDAGRSPTGVCSPAPTFLVGPADPACPRTGADAPIRRRSASKRAPGRLRRTTSALLPTRVARLHPAG